MHALVTLVLLAAAPADLCTVTHHLAEGGKALDTFATSGRWLSSRETSAHLEVSTLLRYDARGRVTGVVRREVEQAHSFPCYQRQPCRAPARDVELEATLTWDDQGRPRSIVLSKRDAKAPESTITFRYEGAALRSWQQQPGNLGAEFTRDDNWLAWGQGDAKVVAGWVAGEPGVKWIGTSNCRKSLCAPTSIRRFDRSAGKLELHDASLINSYRWIWTLDEAGSVTRKTLEPGTVRVDFVHEGGQLAAVRAGERALDRLEYQGACPARLLAPRAPELFALHPAELCVPLTDSARLCHVPERADWILEPTHRPHLDALGL